MKAVLKIHTHTHKREVMKMTNSRKGDLGHLGKDGELKMLPFVLPFLQRGGMLWLIGSWARAAMARRH